MCAKRRARSVDQSGRSRPIEISLEINGRSFTFPLCTRPLNVGLDSPIQYYWINHGLLRETAANQTVNLCDRIVDFWRQAMIEAGAFDQPEQLETYLLARCYRVLSKNKGMQQVFRDAHLGHHVDHSDSSTGGIELSDDIRGRIREVAGRQGIEVLRNEIAAIFDWQPTPAEHRGELNRFLDNWLGFGLRLMAENPETGFEEFVSTVEYWDNLFGTSGRTDPVIRIFRKRFAFESKCAFNTCYTQLWSKLISKLLEVQSLDTVSARFLCFWHMQNPSIVTENAQGQITGEPDVFFGQILALHPLSGHFMQHRELLAVAGRFFGSDAWQAVFENGDDGRQEYWDMIEAIRIAGHLYVSHDTTQQQVRRPRESLMLIPELVAAPAVDQAVEFELLDSCAAELGFLCTTCGSALKDLAFSVAVGNGITSLSGQCGRCSHESTMHVTFDQLRDATRRQSDTESE